MIVIITHFFQKITHKLTFFSNTNIRLGDTMKLLKKISKWGLIFIGILITTYIGIYIYAKISPKLEINSANSFYFYDKDNNLFEKGTSNEWVNLKDISPHLINATIAIEDKHFYKHFGFDYLRILKSLYINFISGYNKQGASTITQQYAKNLFLDFEKRWSRKLEEAWLTIRLEVHYTKNEILEGYLNTINYGGIFGIENAAKFYFNKRAKDLTLAESTILAGIPKHPALFSPLVSEEDAKRRQKLILNAMVKNKFIAEEEMEKAYNEDLAYYGKESNDKNNTLMYYQDAVLKELKEIKSIPTSFLKTGGLKIYTNLDIKLQNLLDEAIKKHMVDKTELQIASVVMNPQNGAIVALTGGTNYSQSQFNRAISSKRQVGSVLKPFLYYAAIENGFTASTTFTSEKTTFAFSENKSYSPKNFDDMYANKPISMALALAYSDNVYAVKTHLFLGEETLVDMASRIGMSDDLPAIPSLALGTQEMNIIDVMRGYAALANEGYKIKPHLIERIEDINGNVLYKHNYLKENVLNKSIVFILNEMLNKCYSTEMVDYGYPSCIGMASNLTKKYSIKTGSTDTDNLIFGFNPELVMGVWTGYDDNRKTEARDHMFSKNVWAEVMEGYFKEHEATWYSMPRNVVGVLVDPVSGKVATEKSKKKTLLYYIKGTEPYIDNNELDNLIPTIKEDE